MSLELENKCNLRVKSECVVLGLFRYSADNPHGSIRPCLSENMKNVLLCLLPHKEYGRGDGLDGCWARCLVDGAGASGGAAHENMFCTHIGAVLQQTRRVADARKAVVRNL